MNFVIAIVSELFMLMTFANDLVNECEILRQDIYFSDWLNLSNQTKIEFLLLQKGMERPLGIKCYNWLNLNYSTFTTVVEISYKWYTMMSKVK